MISSYIIDTLYCHEFPNQILEVKGSMDEMRFRFHFGQQMLESRIVKKDNDLRVNKIEMELSSTKTMETL